MDGSARRILLAVQPGMLQGALARLLSARFDDEVVEAGCGGLESASDGYDVAVVSDELPEGVRAEVVITLPDTRGSGGIGKVARGDVVRDVGIGGAEGLVELLDQCAPNVARRVIRRRAPLHPQ